jgi:hypothetical protein
MAPRRTEEDRETHDRKTSEVLQGTLDLMILKTLHALGPQHGFGIARRIEQVSRDVLQLNEGTVYTALLRLQQQGWIPAAGAFNAVPFTIAGRAVGDRSQLPSARFNQVSPAYFETVGIRIARGRAFTEADRTGTVPVAIVNGTFVKRYFPDVDPLTQRVLIDQFNPGVTNLGLGIERQIVGVSGDVRNLGPASESLPEIHVPFAQSTWARNWIAVRTAGDPLAIQA